MSDADWKKAQSYPLMGEGDLHFRGKQRLRDVLKRCGYYAVLEQRYQVSIHGYAEPVELRTDVYGVTPDRTLCAECNGPGGHKTRQAYDKDNRKATLICEQNGIPRDEYFTFSFKSLVGRHAWTDKEIAEEMRITTLDKPNRKWV